MSKLCRRCNGRGLTVDVFSTAKEGYAGGVATEVGARVDDDTDGMAQAPVFKIEEKGGWGCDVRRMGDGELACQLEDGTWICDKGASTDITIYREYNQNGASSTVALTRSKDTAISTWSKRSRNVAHVPDLRYNVFSLLPLVKNGHGFDERPMGGVY